MAAWPYRGGRPEPGGAPSGRKAPAPGAPFRAAFPLAAFLLSASCDERHPLDEARARRITRPAEWAAASVRPSVQTEIPPTPRGLPSPEFWETTCRIYEKMAAEPPPDHLAAYTESLPAWGESELKMVPVRGGEFRMGSPESEPLRRTDEGPCHRVRVDDFWISAIEIPWELYIAFMDNGRPRMRTGVLLERQPDDELWDLVAQPTAPYTSMNLGMGSGYENGMPAISMSHYAASKFCEWLSAQTGRYYRLPTEAEWEYACRAGTQTAYCYGDGEDDLPQYGWFWNNANDRYQHVAMKKPNAFGLHDMHGNVAEWVLDTYVPRAYAERREGTAENPLVLVPGQNGHVVRGGSWEDDPDRLRSAARSSSKAEWMSLDPQNPKSLWYLSSGGMIGFRIVRPTRLPDRETVHTHWNASKGTW